MKRFHFLWAELGDAVTDLAKKDGELDSLYNAEGLPTIYAVEKVLEDPEASSKERDQAKELAVLLETMAKDQEYNDKGKIGPKQQELREAFRTLAKAKGYPEELVQEYIDEAEHGQGYSYWTAYFQTPEEALEDLKIYQEAIQQN